MSKLPCEVVRDLFPSYIDELTNEVTNHLIEEHLEKCEECQKVLSFMKNPEAEPAESVKEKEEIDFLKKARKKNRNKVVIAVAAALTIIMLIFGINNYFVGTAVSSEYVACQVEVKGNNLSLNGALLNSRFCISDVEFSEENGVVNISFESVHRSPFYESSVEQTYVAEQEITEVHLGDRILWAKGVNISAITSAVYQTAHPYVEDMSANGRTAGALNMSATLGNYTNELQTVAEPYGWHFVLEWQVSGDSYDGVIPMVDAMDAYAYVLLAMVENLGEVTYQYTWGGFPAWRTITTEQASEFAGEDIKAVGKDIAKLQLLMEKADLIDTAYVMDYSQWNPKEEIGIQMVNLTEEELSMIMLYCYVDGELYSNQVVSNANGTTLGTGTVLNFQLLPEDFAGADTEDLVFRIGIRDKDGRFRECVEHVNLPSGFGYTYRYKLTGSMEEGYHISQ